MCNLGNQDYASKAKINVFLKKYFLIEILPRIEEILFCTLILAPEYCANIHFSFFYCAIFAFLAETVYGYWLLVLILCCFYKTVIVSLKYSNLFFNVDI